MLSTGPSFGSTSTFSNQFDPKSDPNDVIIDFKGSRVVDHSALESINELARKYGDLSKKVHLRGLSSDCYQLLERLNGEKADYELMEPGPEDPIYRVARTYSKYAPCSVPRKDAAPPADAEGEVLAVSFPPSDGPPRPVPVRASPPRAPSTRGVQASSIRYSPAWSITRAAVGTITSQDPSGIPGTVESRSADPSHRCASVGSPTRGARAARRIDRAVSAARQYTPKIKKTST